MNLHWKKLVWGVFCVRINVTAVCFNLVHYSAKQLDLIPEVKVKAKLVSHSEELYNLRYWCRQQYTRASYMVQPLQQRHAFYAPAVLAKLIKAIDDADDDDEDDDVDDDDTADDDDGDGQNDADKVRKGCNQICHCSGVDSSEFASKCISAFLREASICPCHCQGKA